MSVWLDDLDFVQRWVQTMPVAVPVYSEIEYAQVALSHHASLLYDCPIFADLTKRERSKYVRKYLDAYGSLIHQHGFIGAISRLKSINDVLLNSLVYASDDATEYTFELVSDVSDSPIFLAILQIEKHHGTLRLSLIRWIHSFHVFLAKIPLDRPDLLGPAESAWIQRQFDLDSVRVEEMDQDVIRSLRYIIGWLIDPIPSDFLVGRHGPGSTAGGFKTIVDKNLNYTRTLQTLQLTRIHPVAYPPPGTMVSNELLMVSKDIGNLRPITPEPPSMQYGQQSLKDEIYRFTDDRRFGFPLSEFVKFSDQKPSQSAALLGSDSSVEWKYRPATIDLSAASDRLHVDLVSSLFSGNLLHMLMCGRTWKTKTSSAEIELRMYGGMGSALTFPVQTIVFTAAAIWATVVADSLSSVGLRLPYTEILRDYLGPDGLRLKKEAKVAIRVYGDDIIVPQYATDELLKLLAHLGLKVNVEKSFIGLSAVREACGVFALGGRDITPLRFRVPTFKKGGLLDFASFDGMRSLANRSFLYGYKTLYRHSIRFVRSRGLLIGSKELRKSKRVGRLYPDQRLDRADLLFEEYRGDSDYIGFISTRASKPSNVINIWESVRSFTTYAPLLEADRDEQSEYYHLTMAYNLMRRRDKHFDSHGQIPRGIRLVKVNAILCSPAERSYTQAWRWAPR